MTENRSRFVLLCQQALACAVVVGVAAPAAGVVDLEFVSPPSVGTAPRATSPSGQAGQESQVATAPVRPSVTEVRLVPTKVASLEGSPQVDGGTGPAEARLASVETHDHGQDVDQPTEAALSEPTEVHGYATVGVTWNGDEQLEDGSIQVAVRSRRDGQWGLWEEIPYEADGGPDPGSAEAQRARGGTNPLVVGDVDDVQVKVVGDGEQLPSGLRLSVIDPGNADSTATEEPAIDTARLAAASTGVGDTADPAEPTEPVEPDPAAPVDPDVELVGTPADVTPKPQIFSRAQWGADERLRDKDSLRYFEVHAGFVHHTVNANGYTREQVPSIIRGIYAYHTQSRGWSDVGYNFLVDRFGRIWEGRAGGVDRPVVGAHTLGYNDYAFAMSAIGNFETAQPSDAMLNAYGRLFAWKLSLHGVDAASRRQQVGDRSMPAINGHRDVGQTACPGRYLYAKLGTIRDRAKANQRPFASRTRDTDVAGTRWPDLVVRDATSQKVYVVRTGGQVGFARGARAARGLGGANAVVVSPDLTGDRNADLLARDRQTGVTALHTGDGSGHFTGPSRSYTKFATLDRMAAVGDMNGDGANDLAGRRDGVLRLYRGTGDGGFRRARVLSEGWEGYSAFTGVGDFDGDGDADLLARRDDALLLVPGTGGLALGRPVALPGSWAGYDVVTGLGDVTNDGHPDLVARKRTSQRTMVFPGNGRGGLGTALGPFDVLVGGDALQAVPGVRGRLVDLVGRNAKGNIVVYGNRGGRNIDGVTAAGQTFGSTDAILNVGDWNGDGNGDVLTRSTATGDLLLRAGNGNGGFAAPVVASRGWRDVRLLSAVGDLTGDGYPDIMGQPRGGALRVYPGNGRSGFKQSFVAREAVSATDQVGIGLWNPDGSPDSLFRRSDGTVVVYRGNGPGGLTGGATQIASGTGGYDWLLGAGDVDGDGYADVLARSAADGRLWLLPGTASALGPRRFVADGFGRYDLGG